MGFERDMRRKVFFVEGVNEYFLIKEICKRCGKKYKKLYEHRGKDNHKKQSSIIRQFQQGILVESNKETGIKIENGCDIIVKYVVNSFIWKDILNIWDTNFVFLFDEKDISKTEIGKTYKIKNCKELVVYIQKNLKISLKEIGRNTYQYKNVYIYITPKSLEEMVKEYANIDLHYLDEIRKKEAIKKFVEFCLVKKDKWLLSLMSIINNYKK